LYAGNNRLILQITELPKCIVIDTYANKQIGALGNGMPKKKLRKTNFPYFQNMMVEDAQRMNAIGFADGS
jgi:hypothetical protein